MIHDNVNVRLFCSLYFFFKKKQWFCYIRWVIGYIDDSPGLSEVSF